MKGDSKDMEKGLNTGILDIAFISRQDYHKYDFIELMEDPIYAVMSPKNPLSMYDPLPIEMLNEAPLLRYISPTCGEVDTDKVWSMINPKIVYTTNFDFSLISMARQDLGICIVPGLVAENDNDGVVMRRLSPYICRTLGMAVTQLSEISPILEAFIECAKKVFNRERGRKE